MISLMGIAFIAMKIDKITSSKFFGRFFTRQAYQEQKAAISIELNFNIMRLICLCSLLFCKKDMDLQDIKL